MYSHLVAVMPTMQPTHLWLALPRLAYRCSVAVVAAILKSGLRIMPHSGGRVGSGIYMASEAGKSVWCAFEGDT